MKENEFLNILVVEADKYEKAGNSREDVIRGVAEMLHYVMVAPLVLEYDKVSEKEAIKELENLRDIFHAQAIRRYEKGIKDKKYTNKTSGSHS